MHSLFNRSKHILKKIFSNVSKENFLFRNIGKTLLGSILFISLCFLTIPSLSFSIGDVFFGKTKPLYNVKLAQFFYYIATHPVGSESPPRYAHYQLSRTYFIEGELEKALMEAELELSIYPDSLSTYYILGLTYGYMGRSHEAIDMFSAYIETHPETWAGRNDKAWLQFRVGDIDGAIQTIEPIVENFKHTVWVQNTYCALLINKKRFVEAKEACNYAKEAVNKMNNEDWGHAYPGNDPRIYATGLSAMKLSIDHNLTLIEKNLKN